MRISDWSSDVCSSDLVEVFEGAHQRYLVAQAATGGVARQVPAGVLAERREPRHAGGGGVDPLEQAAGVVAHHLAHLAPLRRWLPRAARERVGQAAETADERRVGQGGGGTCR